MGTPVRPTNMRASWFFVGLDLGQVHDPTAIAVFERAELTGEWDAAVFAFRKEVRLRLRYLERVALGTPYPAVVERVREVTRSSELAGRCHVIADGTGVGRPVIDLLRSANLGCGLLPVIITNGDTETAAEGYHRVPKRDLIIGLQVLLQCDSLQIARRLAHGPTLAKEMADMRVKTTPSGREQYGAWREGQHDDLVLAASLACWGARKVYPKPPRGENAYWRRTESQPDIWKALM